MTVHTAPGQTAGYLYQCRYALLWALQHTGSYPGLLLSIEHLDDVAFEDGVEPVARLQAKHRLIRTAALTDSCSDLWKTIGIWAAEVASDPAKLETQKLLLVTTAEAPLGSAARLLRAAGRNEATARSQLLSAIAKSRSDVNAGYYETFSALTEPAQTALLKAILMLDCSPSLADLSIPLKHELRFLAEAQSRDAALQRVEGWWWARIAEALVNPTRKHIPLLEVEAFLDTVREAFRTANLPVDFAAAEPPQSTAQGYDARTFVRQLRLVNCQPNRIARAKRDYYRAFEQRSKWSREYLVDAAELSDYERRLIEQWEPRFDRMTEMVSAAATAADPLQAALDLIFWLETDIQQPLRNVTERYLAIGSCHMLADDRRMGWHVDYRRLLDEATSSDETSHDR
jgi:hypothetical protein